MSFTAGAMAFLSYQRKQDDALGLPASFSRMRADTMHMLTVECLVLVARYINVHVC